MPPVKSFQRQPHYLSVSILGHPTGTHRKRAVKGGPKELQSRRQHRSVYIPGAILALDGAIGEVSCLEQLNVVLFEGMGAWGAHFQEVVDT